MDEEKKPNYRLCHVIKRPDFAGYGFHLHAEKGKAGQFIGKVDPNSPAEEAGLRQGDRIVEVNSVRIDHESHREVVDRIKALENEVKLLVIDPNSEPPKSPAATETVTNQQVSNEKSESTTTTTAAAAAPTTVVDGPKVSKAVPIPVVPPPAAAVVVPDSPKTNGTNGEAKVGDSEIQKNGATTTATTTTTKPSGEKDELTSSLSLSVAEMRAKLANKKKTDPKRESVDLRKKYEIVQLL